MCTTKNKAVIRVQMCCERCRSIAMEVASASGIDSVCIEGPDRNRLVVVGICFDPIGLTESLKKKLGCADLISFEECKPPKPEEKPKPDDKPKPEEKPKPKECCRCCPCGRCPPCGPCSGPSFYQHPMPPQCFPPSHIIIQDNFPQCSIM